MRRYPAKRDDNHIPIKKALSENGYFCVDTHMVGGGFPDMVVGRNGRTILVEIKNKQGRNRVDAKQIEFADLWCGDCYVIVYNPDEAITILNELTS